MYYSVLKMPARVRRSRYRDKRVVTDVKTRIGQTLNCVAAGRHHPLQQEYRGLACVCAEPSALTLPANQSTVTASGYTNLELWLQQLDQTLQGVVQAQSPGSPQSLAVR